MITGTIRADGIVWPAQTYIDALGFRECVDGVSPGFDPQVRLVTIDRDRNLVPARYAGEVDWPSTLAFRPLDYTREAAPCRACGRGSCNYSDDLCPDCVDDDDGWNYQ